MEFPVLGPGMFYVLSSLLDGSALTLRELADRLKCDVRGYMTLTLFRFHQRGLIDKTDELLANGKTRRVFSITESGRQVWQESADFYLQVIERSTKPQERRPAPEVLSRKAVSPKEKQIANPDGFFEKC